MHESYTIGVKMQLVDCQFVYLRALNSRNAFLLATLTNPQTNIFCYYGTVRRFLLNANCN